jgi:hypothetical protein
MSSPPTQPHPQGMPPRIPCHGLLKTYAFVYAPGPQWIAGRPGVQQNLDSHRAYIGMENAKIADSRMFHFDTAALLRFLERNAERAASQVPHGVR